MNRSREHGMKQGATRSRKRLSRGEKIIRDRAMVNSVLRVCRHWRYATQGKADPDGLRLVKGHYSRRKPNSKQFMPPGETIVLVNEARDAVWGWWRPHPDSGLVAMNGRDGWTCSVFAYHPPKTGRPPLASELVMEAELALAALEADGLTAAPCGPDGMMTYVWPAKVKSANPGYCYKVAGWVSVGVCARGVKPLLWKPLEIAGVQACGALRDARIKEEIETKEAA